MNVREARSVALPRGSNCDGALVRLVRGDSSSLQNAQLFVSPTRFVLTYWNSMRLFQLLQSSAYDQILHGDETSATKMTPERCREHAKACRAMARAEPEQSKRKALEDIASAWEDLCEELEGR